VYRALPKTCPFRNMTTPLLLELQGLHSTWDCKEKIMQQLRALLPDVDEPDRRGPDACLIVGIYPKYGNGQFHKKAALELRGNNRARALASLLANHVKVKVLHSVQEERYIITAYGRVSTTDTSTRIGARTSLRLTFICVYFLSSCYYSWPRSSTWSSKAPYTMTSSGSTTNDQGGF
jgi:hypothetical protein